jgi:hypothetical protein
MLGSSRTAVKFYLVCILNGGECFQGLITTAQNKGSRACPKEKKQQRKLTQTKKIPKELL